MITLTQKQAIIDCLKRHGADIVGFAPIERFTDGIPQQIMPKAKTVIGVAFRVLRGSHRGIEEGTTFYQYTTTAVETIEENIMPMALLKACGVIEDQGYTAYPQRRNQLIMPETDSTNPEMDYTEIYRGISNELHMNFDESAVLCGLGERGLSGSLLTDKFGPWQRYCFILTDAEIEPDPIVEPHLCDKCGKCVAACPGKALSAEGELDRWQCATYYKGANMSRNPYMPPDAFMDDPERVKIIAGEAKLSPERAKEVIDQIVFYPPMKQGYVTSICGRACDIACYVHLEEKGVLDQAFTTPFRKRPEWQLSNILE